ncbi:hypothetical protein D9615_009751 [Tricholomella constricta]|uniref:Uncharacterized protein n=1 Tax=Tricholomella constricta TaxID=117010 RepID=A0A8H5LV09_9AGAR|nr:hypothetical protein D9615_009751 [Tricholomella constricta]
MDGVIPVSYKDPRYAKLYALEILFENGDFNDRVFQNTLHAVYAPHSDRARNQNQYYRRRHGGPRRQGRYEYYDSDEDATSSGRSRRDRSPPRLSQSNSGPIAGPSTPLPATTPSQSSTAGEKPDDVQDEQMTVYTGNEV